MSRRRQIFILWMSILLAVLIAVLRNLPEDPTERLPAGSETGYRVYYLLNMDGMKGLGHSALMLEEASGEARVYSYNGMQYNLWECLLGKEGIGKMKAFSLSREAVRRLLETGDLEAEEYEECDNFDRVLYRYITADQYELLDRNIQRYIEVGDEFERLYAGDRDGLNKFLAQEDLPRYQIYTHNCDTVARELLALISSDVSAYNEDFHALTPGGSYKKLCDALGEQWGVRKLGVDSPLERLLSIQGL